MKAPSEVEDRLFLARCVSSRDQSAIFDVTHERVSGGSYEVLDDPRPLFPKKGQVELFGVSAQSIEPKDVFSFKAKLSNRHRAPTQMRMYSQRRLERYRDLSGFDHPLTGKGLKAAEIDPGPWIIRIDADSVLRARVIADGSGGVCFDTGRLDRLPVFRFEADRVIKIAPVEEDHFYDVEQLDPILRTLNWQTDVDLVRAALRSVSSREHDGGELDRLASFLERHRASLEARLSGSDANLVSVQADILRTGRMVEVLRGEREIVRGYAEAMRTDPAIAAMVRDACREIAEGDRAAIVASLRAEAEKEIADEVSLLRRRLSDEAERSASDLEADLLDKLDAKEKDRLSEIDRIRAERIAEEAAAQEAFATSMREGKDQLDGLAADRVRATEEMSELERRRSAAIDEVARIEGASRNRKVPTGSAFVSPSVITLFRTGVALPSARKGAEAWRQHLKGCDALTLQGRSLMEAFASLLASGEIPVVHGPDAEDFIALAAKLLAAGRLLFLDADPTMITSDDVWIRPSGQIKTVLGQASEVLDGDEHAEPVIVAIRNADRSGMRFWLPALVESARAGISGRRLMPCVIVEDPEGDESHASVRGLRVLDVAGAFAGNAALAALVNDGRWDTVLDVDRSGHQADALAALGSSGIRSIRLGSRFAALYSVAGQLMSEGDRDSFMETMVHAWAVEGAPQ